MIISLMLVWINNNYTKISVDFLSAAANKESNEYAVIEETLKGKESIIPNGLHFFDKDGNKRTECRVKWWTEDHNRRTFEDIYMECPDDLKRKELSTSELFHSYTDNRPVFFGHYWLKGNPKIENRNAISLDYGVAKQGKLVACRLNKIDDELKFDFIY